MNEREDMGRRLYEACLSGSVPALDALIEKDQLILDRVSSLACFSDNRLEAFKTLVQYLHSNHMEFLLNAGDGDGNTILHLAAALKQKDNIEYLLGIKSVKDHANVKNKNGSTALDVVELYPNKDLKTMEIRESLLQVGVRRFVCSEPELNPESPSNNPPPQRCCKAGVLLIGYISRFWTNYIKVDLVWLQEVRGHLITAATLTASVACQSILNPPGGFWQDTKGSQYAASPALSPPSTDLAGHAILDSNMQNSYAAYVTINTIMLIASLSTIMLAMTGFPISNKLLTWLLIFTMYITISCMAGAYVLAMSLVSPNMWAKFVFASDIFFDLLTAWVGLCAFIAVLHLCRFLVRLGNKLVKLVKACYRCCGPTPRAAHNITTDQVNPVAGNHRCMGNFC